jgi:hypothetical protein
MESFQKEAFCCSVLKTDTHFTSQERNPVFEGKYKTTTVSDLMTE